MNDETKNEYPKNCIISDYIRSRNEDRKGNLRQKKRMEEEII
jgi:hypothetical protein